MAEGTGRVEAFSDGVFAIAITLLILEIRVPHAGVEASLWTGLVALWPSYLAFALSFFVILIMWVNHHELMRLVCAVGYPFLFANGLVLLTVTFVFLYLAAIALQFYAAGLAVFGVSTFMTHALFGYSMILGAIILLLLSFVARLARRIKILASVVLLLTMLQPVLALIRSPIPVLAALHPVNALIIFAIAARIATSTTAPKEMGSASA